MAKRNSRRTTSRKKTQTPSLAPGFTPGVPREILAILMAALTLLLLFAVFNFGGTLVTSMFHGLRLTVGYAAYLLPVVTGALAYMLFRSSVYEVTAATWIGFIGFVVALAGLFHIGVPVDAALDRAKAAAGGGYVGYGVSALLLQVLNVAASAVILVALLGIFLIVAANARMGSLLAPLRNFFKREPVEPEIQVNEPLVASATALPMKGSLDLTRGVSKSPEPETALVGKADPDWNMPALDLVQAGSTNADAGNIKENAAIIQQTLSSFGIEVAMGEVNVGPTVAQYTLKPSSGVKLNKITGLEHNLALSLAAPSIRVEAPIPGKGAVGVEIPNKTAAMVRMRDLLADPEIAANTSPLNLVLGRDVAGLPMTADLAKMPHMLIAGATGSGKSVMINALLTSLLYHNSPANLKLILVDPKRVELSLYNNIPHLLTPVIVEPEKCISALKWAVAEMERRYKLLAEVGKRNIIEYNTSQLDEPMPYIVIVIDELADLMAVAAQDVESLIVRLAQMARAVGIHLVLATQRPSVDVITGLIKANIPARLAFTVASQIDSRTILDQAGAEKLVGKGDMLFSSPEFIKPKRVQGVYLDEKEIKAVTDYLREARAPQYNDEVLTQAVKIGGRSSGGDFGEPDDDLFNEAAEAVLRAGKASASMLQRRLRVGYARAARLLDLLEERGIIGPADGARPRDVLISSMDQISASNGGTGAEVGPDFPGEDVSFDE